ncbi:MAG: endospore germination permease [Firmicutes bacterium]|nr:endospore germination permease [Bacillota bacterium]
MSPLFFWVVAELERGQISGPQATFLVIGIILPTAILFLPAFASEAARQNAWIVPWVALPQGVAALALAWTLSKNFPGMTPAQYAAPLLGKVAGKIVAVLLILYVFIPAAVILREFAEFIVIAFLPSTPPLVLAGLVGLLSAYCIRGGLEVVARVATLVMILILASFFLILLLVLNMVDFHNLQPWTEVRLRDLVRGALPPGAWMGEVTFAAYFLPFVYPPRTGFTACLAGLVIITLVLSVNAAFTTAVFGASDARLIFPFFELARQVNIADFITRIDAVIMVVWVAGNFVKFTVWLYVGTLATAQMLNLRDYRPLLLPLVLTETAWAVLFFDSVPEMTHWVSKTWPPYSATMQILLPLLLLGVAKLKATLPGGTSTNSPGVKGNRAAGTGRNPRPRSRPAREGWPGPQ